MYAKKPEKIHKSICLFFFYVMKKKKLQPLNKTKDAHFEYSSLNACVNLRDHGLIQRREAETTGGGQQV